MICRCMQNMINLVYHIIIFRIYYLSYPCQIGIGFEHVYLFEIRPAEGISAQSQRFPPVWDAAALQEHRTTVDEYQVGVIICVRCIEHRCIESFIGNQIGDLLNAATGRRKQEAVALGTAVPVTIAPTTRRPIIRIAGSTDPTRTFGCRTSILLINRLCLKK